MNCSKKTIYMKSQLSGPIFCVPKVVKYILQQYFDRLTRWNSADPDQTG